MILFEELIKRIRALTCKLLPFQVELDEISKPTSRIITPKVVSAYSQAAGDFGEAVGYWPASSMTYSYRDILVAVLPSAGKTDIYLGEYSLCTRGSALLIFS